MYQSVDLGKPYLMNGRKSVTHNGKDTIQIDGGSAQVKPLGSQFRALKEPSIPANGGGVGVSFSNVSLSGGYQPSAALMAKIGGNVHGRQSQNFNTANSGGEYVVGNSKKQRHAPGNLNVSQESRDSPMHTPSKSRFI